jgi:predicted acyl esterase
VATTPSGWFSAAERPPHLAAIAPWEGMSDYYRNMALRGGIPTGDEFVDFILTNFVRGTGTVEDVPRNVIDNPLYNAYWQSKRAEVEKIDVPAYVVASWTQLHSSGTLAAYRALTSEKWLRVHNTHEWPDFYEQKHIEELRRFFDHYLLGADNGWESTPRVRLSVIDPGGTDVVDQAETEFPLSRTTFQALYLDGDNLIPLVVSDC